MTTQADRAQDTVTVAVIPAAGRGTRLRPATRSVPKAFVPVVDRPAIQHVVEEAARAGATEIYVVVDEPAAELVRSHFHVDDDHLPGLEHTHIEPVVQISPNGLGDAVLSAAAAVGDRPFFCMLSDNLLRPGGDVLGAEEAVARGGRCLLAVRTLDESLLDAYGVVVPGPWLGDGLLQVDGAIEKPGALDAPSRLGIVGRYLFEPIIFEALRATAPGHGGEVQLTDAIARVAAETGCLGQVFEKELLDIGTPYGLVHASTILAAEHPEWGAEYRTFVSDFVSVWGDHHPVWGTGTTG